MPLKFRFALLTAALMLVLSVNALANSGEGAPEAPAPAQEETAEKASPFAPLRTYAGEFADVKSGDCENMEARAAVYYDPATEVVEEYAAKYGW